MNIRSLAYFSLFILSLHSISYSQTSMDSKAWSNGIDLDNDKVLDITFLPQVVYHGCDAPWVSEISSEGIFYRKMNAALEIKTTGNQIEEIISRTCSEIDYCVTNVYLGESQNYLVTGGAYFDKDSILEFNGGNLGENLTFNGLNIYSIKFVPENTILNSQAFESAQLISKNIYPYYRAFNTNTTIEDGFQLSTQNIVRTDSIWYCKKFKSESDKTFYLGFKKHMITGGPTPDIYDVFGWVKFSFKEDNFSANAAVTCDTSQIEILEAFIGERNQIVTVGLATPVYTKNQARSIASLYPNPSAGTFTIQNAANKTIFIYDVHGKLILEKTIKTESETISLENSHSGVYQVIIEGEEKPIPFFLQE